MKLTIESDEGVKEEWKFKNCLGCLFFDWEYMDCSHDTDVVTLDNGIPDKCPFKKKE